MPPSVQNGKVLIVSDKPPLHVLAWMDSPPPVISGGGPSWEKVLRPRRMSLTQWQGQDPLQMTLSIVLDDFIHDGSIETQAGILEHMSRPPQPLSEPPIVRLHGNVPHTELHWVIQPIIWGDSRRAPHGERSRQQVVLTLWQYVAEDRLPELKAAEEARNLAAGAVFSANLTGGGGGGGGGGSSAQAPKQKTYIVRDGDTIASIAADQYGDFQLARMVANVNGIRDYKNIQPGQRIRLP